VELYDHQRRVFAMSDNNAKRLIAQAIDVDGGGKLLEINKNVGGGDLNHGEGRASREFFCFDRMRDFHILMGSLEAEEPKQKLEILLPSNFGRKSLKSVMAGKCVKNSVNSCKK
jgi:hypothetical protein